MLWKKIIYMIPNILTVSFKIRNNKIVNFIELFDS
jgi:hypothetical protein